MYKKIETVHDALKAALEAEKEGLEGFYPKALRVLAENYGELLQAATETIDDNLELADGDNCTLIKLKRAVNYDD